MMNVFSPIYSECYVSLYSLMSETKIKNCHKTIQNKFVYKFVSTI